MSLLKRILKIVIFLTLLFMFIPIVKDIKIKKKVDNVINNKKNNSIYEGYIYIPKLDYKSLIKKGESALDENLVELPSFSDEIGGNNIVLAGHNDKYTFNKIYYLDIGDEIIISDFSVDYKYKVFRIKTIDVDDYDELDYDNSLILMTCTSNNQKRYIVISKRE